MGKPIHKITQLTNIETFVQINFIRGYKYIDKAGEIVNLFYSSKDEQPNFQMDRNFLSIQKPAKPNEEIRISVRDFWGHFLSPDSLDKVATEFEKNAANVLKIVEVDNLKRIGWRNYFVYELNKKEVKQTKFASMLDNENLNLTGLEFSTELHGFNLNFRTKKVIKNDSRKTPSILIDVDCFKEYDNDIKLEKLKLILNEARTTLQSKEFLEIINQLISK